MVAYSLGTKCILSVGLNAEILLVASRVIDAPKQIVVSFCTISTFRISTYTLSVVEQISWLLHVNTGASVDTIAPSIAPLFP